MTRVYRERRRETAAVRDVSLTAREGELTVLVGPSGCGKTTILRLIAGLDEPTRGDIRIGERLVNRLPPKDRDVAMVFQNYALYPHMTVSRNMAFGLKMRGVDRAEVDRAVREAAAWLGLDALLDRRPATLSGGEKQRVALGRAVVRRPRALLLDEPLANLDAQLRVQLRSELKSLQRRLGATVIHVTHDQEEAMILADQLIVLERGEVRQSGTPLEAYNQPANRFVAGFLGTPPMNFVEGRLAGEGTSLWFESLLGRWRLTAEAIRNPMAYGAPITLGIRPEAARLAVGGVDAAEFVASGAGSSLVAVDMVVTLVETLGHCMHVHLEHGAQRLTVRAHAHAPRQAGERVRVVVDLTKAKLFDTSGRSLQ